jgi:hypothetical protein
MLAGIAIAYIGLVVWFSSALDAALKRRGRVQAPTIRERLQMQPETQLANQAASLERRETGAIPIDDHWRGVGEPRR